jgi:probable F420-dependent oxidoreductase
MKIDGGMMGRMEEIPAAARALEDEGYDGFLTAEISSDPFLPLVLAAEHTRRIELLTSIAVAFARNPMTLANIGHDLNCYSQGRFILGLGSQIKPHITRRFSMPWSRPAARMREFILAMRAIWSSWYQGDALDFRGEFYTHTLMTPMFTPEDSSFGSPRVFLAAVGPRMTEVAGEVADGMIAHAFTTERYLREVSLPALERGLAKAGRARASFEISCPVFVVTGATEEEYRASRSAVAQQISFYASKPAYRPVLELHGWGDLQSELHRLSKIGQWQAMGDLITEDLLATFAVCGEPHRIAADLKQRYDGLVDRVTGGFPSLTREQRAEALEQLRN